MVSLDEFSSLLGRQVVILVDDFQKAQVDQEFQVHIELFEAQIALVHDVGFLGRGVVTKGKNGEHDLETPPLDEYLFFTHGSTHTHHILSIIFLYTSSQEPYVSKTDLRDVKAQSIRHLRS